MRHLLDQPGDVRPAGPLHQPHLHVDREVLEDVGLVADGGALQDAPDVLGAELAGQRLGDGRGVQRLAERAHLRGVALLEHQPHFRSEQRVAHV